MRYWEGSRRGCAWQIALPLRLNAHDNEVGSVALGAKDVGAQDRAAANGHLHVVLEAVPCGRGFISTGVQRYLAGARSCIVSRALHPPSSGAFPANDC